MRTFASALALMAALLVTGIVEAAQPEATDTIEIRPLKSGEVSGPYITTDPQTGDRILGVARPAPDCAEPERYGAVYVVPEIEVPAQQQPAKPVLTYQPGAEVPQPGVYRPGN
ncbi:hypothetical protein [Desulfocurvibacter africanus]|uniref:Uncharacterized protein n=1 Tax=Desulfocurvibacter africanus subsp. africanus str. Walvis Bay TaxID=690850 RepID=F3YWY9_DESAF|nr:hypothetical protein [Desulfocurvibacter africanus]EGJ51713.1 hypothetical protein Desaf_3427 [Desulfocurvibacter africanus subsp. africanus str. Walvis Bay]